MFCLTGYLFFVKTRRNTFVETVFLAFIISPHVITTESTIYLPKY